MKIRVAIFIGGYLPAKKYGGPVTSISNLVENLGNDIDFYIISNDHDFGDNRRLPNIKDGWNQVGKAKVLYIKEKEYRMQSFKEILKEIQVDCIYLSSVFYYQMNFPAIRAAKGLGIPVLLAPRGELTSRALAIGGWKKKPYLTLSKCIFNNISFHATSKDEYENTIRTFSAPQGNIFLLPNMPPASVEKQMITKCQGKLKILTMSRIVKNKNTLYSINLVKKLHGNIEFDIYGPIEDQNYWAQCENAIKNLPENIQISYKGIIDPNEAHNVYLNYDCLLLPTEFENYGQVIAEALMHDCPPVISFGTTPWDSVNNCGAGYAITIGNDEEFVSALESLCNLDNEGYKSLIHKTRDYVAKTVKIDSIKNDYIAMFSKVANNKGENRK